MEMGKVRGGAWPVWSRGQPINQAREGCGIAIEAFQRLASGFRRGPFPGVETVDLNGRSVILCILIN
jgi:hypothetical protein